MLLCSGIVACSPLSIVVLSTAGRPPTAAPQTGGGKLALQTHPPAVRARSEPGAVPPPPRGLRFFLRSRQTRMQMTCVPRS